jgi:hypothetical protein
MRHGTLLRRKVDSMHKLGIALLVALSLIAIAAVPALASSGSAVTSTLHQHDSWTEWDNNPLTGNPVEVTWDGNEVVHETYFPAKDSGTYEITVTGTVSFTDPAANPGVAYSGRATFHSTDKFGPGRESGTSTLTVHAMGSDGSSVWGHEAMHITYNGNGVLTVSFDKMRFD